MSEPAKKTPETFGRYVLYPPIARGGMATVHTARLLGAEGFSRLVAAKRLHPHLTDDEDFVAMFHDEARIASRIHHTNVVPVLDVVEERGEVILVQEYVHGVPLSQLFRSATTDGKAIPIRITVAIVCGVLAGLHAAHEAKDELEEPLHIVHRDVSPQNVMISIDGIPRLLDFGIAKARTSAHQTRDGFFKGKLAYMAPEQIRMEEIERQADIYAAGVILWELLTRRRFYEGQNDAPFVAAVIAGSNPTVTQVATPDGDDAPFVAALEPIVTRAMAVSPRVRFATADDMLHAILAIAPAAPALEVARWVKDVGSEYLDKRQRVLAANEESLRRISVTGVRVTMAGVELRPSRSPASGVIPVTPIASIPAGPVFSGAPHAMSIAPAPPRSTRALPWMVAGAALVAIGMLIGTFQVDRHPAAAASPPANAIETLPAAAEPPTSNPAEAIAIEPPKHTQAIAPQPVIAVHAAIRAAPPPPPRSVAPPSPPPAPSAAAPAAKPDCNPPFYFEGPKKIFKPACL